MKFLLLLFFAIIALSHCAPSTLTPEDCKKKLKKADDNFKIALIITNPKETLYQTEPEFNEKFCK